MDAPARQQRDVLVAEEPGHRFRCVARVCVLGHEQDEPAAELLVERCEQERQRRLGHPRSGGQRLGEGAETLALAKLGGEWMQDRTVHD